MTLRSNIQIIDLERLTYFKRQFFTHKKTSSGYLAEKVLINCGIHFPSFDSIPYEVQDIAFKSYFGGRFEILKRGFIGQAYLYDINSAYPDAITKISDLTDGKWSNRKTIHPHAKLGFFKILADIPVAKEFLLFRLDAMGIFCFQVANLLHILL